MFLLFPQGNFDHHTAHDVIQLKVFLRAVRMGIVTANAGLADGAVSVDGLEIGLIADLDRTSGKPFWMFSRTASSPFFSGSPSGPLCGLIGHRLINR